MSSNGEPRRAPKFPLRLNELDAKRAKAVPAPAAAPTGIGLDSAEMRRRMAQRLRHAGVQHEAVLDAMATVPRHQFVDAALVAQAYEDTSLPIGHGQTISKPSVVARMIELLMGGENARRAQGLGQTLEIGTGCGYQAAVLSLLARQVLSVERLRPLHDKARTLLAPLRSGNLRLVSPLRQPGSDRQLLMVVDRSERGYHHTPHEAVHFVPLKSGVGA